MTQCLHFLPKVPTTYLENKRLARQAVLKAVRSGFLEPISSCRCEVCGTEAHSYHHDSYEPEYWLNVTPLCNSCHKTLHSVGSEALIDTQIEKLTGYLKEFRKQLRYAGELDTRALLRHIPSVEKQLRWLEEYRDSTT